MRHRFFSLLVAVFIIFSTSACNHTTSKKQSAVNDSLVENNNDIAIQKQGNAAVDTVTIHSVAMNLDKKAVVVTPASYQTSQKKYPVVYILHGYSDNYATYIQRIPHLKALADEHRLILVFPDGGYNSWYLNSPEQENYQYETHIVDEVRSFIEQNYRTISKREARAITGHSMGGHGATSLAFKHQDVFGMVGSMSGGVDLTYNTSGWEIKEKLGSYEQYQQRWHDNSAFHLLDKIQIKNLPMIIDCGVNDFFIDINRNFHQKLLEKNIPHDYIERPGKHNWQYWDNAIDYQMLFFAKEFNKIREQ